MSRLDEAAASASPLLRPALLEGLDLLSQAGEVRFYGYQRYVLPVDGYVFWVLDTERRFTGSLHVSSDQRQLEDETVAYNQVVFTTAAEIQDFNAVSGDYMWVGIHNVAESSTPIRFAFSQRREFYQQAGLFHYVGMSVYPALLSQLIDDPAQLVGLTPIVSNSLPAWLALNTYKPIDVSYPSALPVMLYPSYAVPDNLPPPYGVVHIEPGRTEPYQMVPFFDRTMNQSQLVRDYVRVTLYGLNNAQIMDFYALFLEYCTNGNALGLGSSPIVRDEKRTQSELNILAQKKTIDVSVNYNQSAMRNVARRLITQAASAVSYAQPELPLVVGRWDESRFDSGVVWGP